MTSGDHNPPNNPNFYIFDAFRIFMKGERQDLKFAGQVDLIQSQPT